MRLFSEKVTPSFTNSDLNILTVESFQEVFFDVFEFEINGKKFMAEKVSEYKGHPVVAVPVTLDNKKIEVPFVLTEGDFCVYFNRKNTSISEPPTNYSNPVKIKFDHDGEEVEEVLYEDLRPISRDIKKTKKLATAYANEIKEKLSQQVTEQYTVEVRDAIEIGLIESRQRLVSEFIELTGVLKKEINEYTNEDRASLQKFVSEALEKTSNELVEKIHEDFEQAEKRFTKEVNELAIDLLSGVLLEEIKKNREKISSDLHKRFSDLTEQVVENINTQTAKNNNKALSRIGNVKVQLEETISDVSEDLLEQIASAEQRVRQYYDEKVSLVEDKFSNITDEHKAEILILIEKSKDQLLQEVEKIRSDLPSTLLEEATNKQKIDQQELKDHLEKVLGNKFNNELSTLRRLVELTSGGGPRKITDFSDGGEMNGALSVKGNLSLINSDLAINNGNITLNGNLSSEGDLSINGTVSAVEYLGGNLAYTNANNNFSTSQTFQQTLTVLGDGVVQGNLTVLGAFNPVTTISTSTSALCAVNAGTRTALYVCQQNVGGDTCVAELIGTGGGLNINKTGTKYTIGRCATIGSTSAASDFILSFGRDTHAACTGAIALGTSTSARGIGSNVLGGSCNTVTTNVSYGTIAGGQNNSNNSTLGIIGGGLCNCLGFGTFGVIAGGQNNYAADTNQPHGTVGGGFCNRITVGSGSTIAGGLSGSIIGSNSFIGGGCCNTVCNSIAIIAGGACNFNNRCGSTISGGFSSRINGGEYAVIGGGRCNLITGNLNGSSTIGGGCGNYASASDSTVAGGNNNCASNSKATVGGGRGNTASGTYSTIGGGDANTASGTDSTIAGGDTNTASGTHSTIAGGFSSRATGANSFIGGGRCNIVTGTCSVVVGGTCNTTGATSTFIGGGCGNTASGNYTFIAGGSANCIQSAAFRSSILAGANITATCPDTGYMPRLILTCVPTVSTGCPSGTVWRCSANNLLYIVP